MRDTALKNSWFCRCLLRICSRYARSKSWLWQTLAKHEQQIIRAGRFILIGYSSFALVLTLGVITSVAWRHPDGVVAPTKTATNSRPDAKIQESGHADAGRSAYGVPIPR